MTLSVSFYLLRLNLKLSFMIAKKFTMILIYFIYFLV